MNRYGPNKDIPEDPTRCVEAISTGHQCGNYRVRGKEHCWTHDPARRARKREDSRLRRERQRFADREEREAQHRRESCSQCGEHGKHAENCPGWEVRRGEEEVSGRTLLVINPRNKDAPGCSFGIPAPIADWLLRVLAADKKGEI